LLTPPLLKYVARLVHAVLWWRHQVLLAGVGRAHCASCCPQSWKTSYMWRATTADGNARICIVYGLRRRRRCCKFALVVSRRDENGVVYTGIKRVYRNMTYPYTIILCVLLCFIDGDGYCSSDESYSLRVGGNCARRVFRGLALQIIL